MQTIEGLTRSHYAGELREKHIGERVTLMGWVQRARQLGGLVFIDLRDRSGISQIVCNQTDDSQIFEKANQLGSEYVIAIQGIVKKRDAVNDQMPTGQIEVVATDLRILSESATPPIYIKDDDQVSESLRLQYRYLDLRKPSMYQKLKTRHEIVRFIRNYLSDHGFLEIETPILNKPTPEGARDFLVPSRVQAGNFFALPQSPQLFKQILMVSGIDRYFQVAKCFRDEDLRADRQPEFTQIDCEMSFVKEEDVMQVMEKMVASLCQTILGKEISLPIPRMTYQEAMSRYGSDKPDTRFAMELIDVTHAVKDCGFQVFEKAANQEGSSVRGIVVKGQADAYSRKKIDALEKVAKTYGAKGLAWMKYQEEIHSPIAKFLSPESLASIQDALQLEKGDLAVFVADQDAIVYDALGHVRLTLGKELNLIDESRIDLLYVTEFPLFEYDEEAKRYVASHHPFTAPMVEDSHLFDTNPAKMRARAYDMVYNGVELGGGSIRISDPAIQRKMFETLGFTQEKAEEKFGFLLQAFSYGVPPHGGIAFGLDRMVMLLTGADNIREVIAFPKTQNASCLMTGAPNQADSDSLEELHIQLAKPSKEK